MEFEKAIETNTLEDWIAYWKRCRLLVIRYDRDAIDDPDNLLVVRYKDTMKRGKEIPGKQFKCRKESIAFQGLREVFPNQTDALIEQATVDFFTAQAKTQSDFEEYQKYKENGNLEVQVVDQSTPLTFEGIRNASVEELFQTKLEIFESPPVQETDQKEYRSNIRKSQSIIEAIYWYYLIANKLENDLGHVDDDIDYYIDYQINSEKLFKFKLQLFEKEVVQNSENKAARSAIRKAKNLMGILIPYQEIINEHLANTGEDLAETPFYSEEDDPELPKE